MTAHVVFVLNRFNHQKPFVSTDRTVSGSADVLFSQTLRLLYTKPASLGGVTEPGTGHLAAFVRWPPRTHSLSRLAACASPHVLSHIGITRNPALTLTLSLLPTPTITGTVPITSLATAAKGVTGLSRTLMKAFETSPKGHAPLTFRYRLFGIYLISDLPD